MVAAASRARLLSWCVALLVVTACAPRSQVRVPLDDRPAPLHVIKGIDVTDLLRSVARTIKQLGLPLSSPVYAHFYDSAPAFELGLVTDARVETWNAKDQASVAAAVGTRHGIFIRVDRLAQMSPASRVRLVAHELTHVSQFELAAGGLGPNEVWLWEGFADWVAYRVIDTHGLGTYASIRERVVNGLRRAPQPSRGLRQLSTHRQWTTAAMQDGERGTYSLAFLAADWLVERFGQGAMVTYFRRAGIVLDGDQAFREAFGLTLTQFNGEFAGHLAALTTGR